MVFAWPSKYLYDVLYQFCLQLSINELIEKLKNELKLKQGFDPKVIFCSTYLFSYI